MKKAAKSPASKSQLDDALGEIDKNAEKKKVRLLILSYFFGRRYFDDDGSQNYLEF